MIWALNEAQYASVKAAGELTPDVLNANSVVSAQGKHEEAVLEDG